MLLDSFPLLRLRLRHASVSTLVVLSIFARTNCIDMPRHGLRPDVAELWSDW
jgi:hypothetical protein